MPSQVIQSIGYDHESNTLRVTFVSGNIYDYKDVPEQVYLAFMTSGAKGNFLNQQIKPYFAYKRIK